MILILGLVFAICCGATETKEERETVGYVFDSTGDWMQDGVNFAHKSGDPVYAGAVVAPDPAYEESEAMSAAIIINLFNGKREERSSERPADFKKPIKLPKSLGEQTSPMGRFLRAMGGLFARHPEKYLITTVRGLELLQLHEAVLKLDGNEINFSPVFKDARTGRYLVRLRPLENQVLGESNELSKTLAFNWKPGSEQRVRAPELRSGLWGISVVSDEDERPVEFDAWVLICKPEQYGPAARTFEQAVMLTNQWGVNASATEVQSFLRTALDVLAQQPEK